MFNYVQQLKALIDRKTGKVATKRPRFVKQDQVMIAELQTAGVICLETFKDFPQMARFTLRDEGWSVNECGFVDAWYMYVYL